MSQTLTQEVTAPLTYPLLDQALARLDQRRSEWAQLSLGERIQILNELKQGMLSVSEEWVERSLEAKGGKSEPAVSAQEYLAGPYSILRNLTLLIRTLTQILKHGSVTFPGLPQQDAAGQVSVPVFPTDLTDRLLFMGVHAEIRLKKAVTLETLAQHTATAYKTQTDPTPICLVLGGGNVSSIGPMDCLYKLFNEKKLCILKMHPVNGYVGPLLEKAFDGLISRGFLEIVYGDAAEGAYLCSHPTVDEVHITGSDKTHDIIVFGKDPSAMKAKKETVLNKPITSELGNVSPVIVLPDVWRESDLVYQARNIVSSLANNAGFNCNASRVVVTHRSWPQRTKFLELIREELKTLPTRNAYYPGAQTRFKSFTDQHPEAESYGQPEKDQLPWLFIPNLNPNQPNDVCFTTEAFCSVFAEVSLEAPDTIRFIEAACEFSNQTLWGTLNATILVHPKTIKEKPVSAAFQKLLSELRYGTISINQWAAIGYALCSTSWGAYPEHTIYDIKSGLDVVHNTYMFDEIEKSIIWSPFRQVPPPPYFTTNRNAGKLAKNLTQFEGQRGFVKFIKVVASAIGL